MRSKLCDQLKWRNAVPVLLLILTVWVLKEFHTGTFNNTMKSVIHVVDYAIHGINATTSAKPIRIRYDPKVVPHRYRDQVDVAELCSWGNEPKESWERHYQNIFQKYNISSREKSYGQLKCNLTFERTMMANMDVVSKYHFNLPNTTYLHGLSLDKKGIDELTKPMANPRKYPLFVTAASSDHYLESQGLIQTYHQLLNVHPELEMIYYDIGLSPEQRKELKKYCKCDVRTFEGERYPKHISQAKTYAWKPVIIQTVLQEYDLVMWVDASIRFHGETLDLSSLLARQRGFQIMVGGGSIAQRTKNISFKFLNESPCLFNFPETPTGWIVVSRNRFTLEYIMRPWVSCALSYNCMVYDNCLRDRLCGGQQLYHDCHRYEQSILGILLSRLFNRHRNIVLFDTISIMTVRRSHQVHYFDKLQNNVDSKVKEAA